MTSKLIWEDNTKTYLGEVDCEVVNWIKLSVHMVQKLPLVNPVINFTVP